MSCLKTFEVSFGAKMVSQKVLLWCSLHIAKTHVAIGLNFSINQQPSIRRVIESETGDLHAA